jgi:exopolysaccharide production protein ExoZ
VPTAVAGGIPSLLLLAGTIGMEAAGRLPRRVAALAFLGDGSYFLYLSHILLVDMLILTPLAWLRGSAAGIMVATVLIAVLIAALSVPAFTRLERPMLLLLRRLTRRG